MIMSSHSMQDASVTTMMVRLSDLRERGVTREAGGGGEVYQCWGRRSGRNFRRGRERRKGVITQ